ncbi:MAG: restriction endonuclease subunit S [Blastocatellia bacterium]
MKEIPNSWVEAKVTALCEKIRGVSYDKQEASREYQDGFIPILRANNIENDHLTFQDLVYVPPIRISQKQRLQFGDVVVAMSSGSKSVVGKTAQLLENWNGSFGAFCGVLRPTVLLEPRYFGYFFRTKHYREKVSGLSAGTNINNLKNEHFEIIDFPLPPLNEQRRIVEKLEKLLVKVDACQKRLERIPRILKRFRQSVLAAACSGRLTADWRKSEEEETELPAEWSWILLEDLLPKGGIFDGPFGSNLKTSDYTASGVRVIRLENIGHLTFFNEKGTYISREKYETLTKHTVGCGDIIFSSFIADEIRVCVLPQLKTKAIAKADCFCLRPIAKLSDRTFLVFQLASRESYNALVDNVHGATRPRINTTQLRKLKVRMAPLPEQQEIVRRVEALFKVADQIEARYNKAKAYVDKLAQSILAKAFRGELVPQDPNDEPASVLLERIHGQRTIHETTNKKARPLSKKKQASLFDEA